jgi:hypothetical protein
MVASPPAAPFVQLSAELRSSVTLPVVWPSAEHPPRYPAAEQL